MADETKTKQGAITPADTAGTATPAKRWRVPGFSGSYKNVKFNDNGESDRPVSAEVAAEFRAQFPNVSIEEIADDAPDAPAPEAKQTGKKS